MVTEIAATIAFSAIQNNDKIGVIFFSDKIEKYIPPKKGRKHILYIIREMLDFHADSKRTDIGSAIEFMTKVMKRHSTVFLISDFYNRESITDAMVIANKKHDVIAIQVYDRRAKELPDVGILKVVDSETGHEMYIDTSDKRIRRAHAAYWMEQQEILRNTFTKSNVDSISVATHEDYVKKLMMLFSKRS